MSQNKRTVQRYIDGFNKSDTAQILSCLTDDIEWTVFGWFHLVGKAAYGKEVENPAFVGPPRVEIARMVEENDVVMAELAIEFDWADGRHSRMVAGEVFVMRGGLIAERRAYLVELKENDFK